MAFVAVARADDGASVTVDDLVTFSVGTVAAIALFLFFRLSRLGTAMRGVVDDPQLLPLETVVRNSDILILGAPHEAYRSLATNGKDVVDVWGVLGSGIRL